MTTPYGSVLSGRGSGKQTTFDNAVAAAETAGDRVEVADVRHPPPPSCPYCDVPYPTSAEHIRGYCDYCA